MSLTNTVLFAGDEWLVHQRYWDDKWVYDILKCSIWVNLIVHLNISNSNTDLMLIFVEYHTWYASQYKLCSLKYENLMKTRIVNRWKNLNLRLLISHFYNLTARFKQVAQWHLKSTCYKFYIVCFWTMMGYCI